MLARTERYFRDSSGVLWYLDSSEKLFGFLDHTVIPHCRIPKVLLSPWFDAHHWFTALASFPSFYKSFFQRDSKNSTSTKKKVPASLKSLFWQEYSYNLIDYPVKWTLCTLLVWMRIAQKTICTLHPGYVVKVWNHISALEKSSSAAEKFLYCAVDWLSAV